MEYEILGVSLEADNTMNVSICRAKIVFRRRMEYHLISTFLQTFILIGVGCLTLLFAEDNFTDRVMVSVTTLLVVVTLMSSIQAVRGRNTFAPF